MSINKTILFGLKTPNLFKCIIQKKFSTSTRQFAIISVKNSNLKEAIQTIKRIIKVEFNKGEIHEYPWLFLQDNCTCSKCFHESSKSRARLMTQLNLENCILTANLNNNHVECKWSDGHESCFSEQWLNQRSFSIANIKKRKETPRDDPILFHAKSTINIDNFNDVLNDEKKLLNVLQILSKEGVFLLEGAEKKCGQLNLLANKIGFIRKTHYGEIFTVRSEVNAVNLAYTSTTLGVHTDLPYYVYPPGIQILHCIKQFAGIGGTSHLVDGFTVASEMKSRVPLKFKALSTIPVEFYDIGEDATKFHKVHHSPTFVIGKKNEMRRIVYSNQQLSSFLPIETTNVKALYEALKHFTNLCYDQRFFYQFKLKEGDVFLFDNWRFLHGREGFDTTKGERHLEGCYLDWDEVFSTINVLKTSIKSNN